MSRALRSAVTSRLSPAMSPTIRFEFDLVKLPEELICLVIEHVDQPKCLARLSRTCRQLQRLAEHKLYRHHTLRSAYEGDVLQHSLDNTRTAREQAIHTIAFLMNAEFDQSFECLHDLLTRSTKLREFSFQSPECNGSEFDDEDDWTDMTDFLFQPFQDATMLQHPPMMLTALPLQMLNKLTLHMNGIESPYWNFDYRSRTIFLLPALRYLKISCVNILDDVAEGINKTSFSPLTHLDLEECNFTHQGLHDVLSFPKALVVLELHENCHNVRHFPEAIPPSWNKLFKNNPAATLAALSQQKTSLVELSYATPYHMHRWGDTRTFITPDKTPVDGGFAEFLALEKIKLVGECTNFERAVASSKAPPNLRLLVADSEYPLWKPRQKLQTVDGPSGSVLDFVPFFRAPSRAVPGGLARVELAFGTLPINHHELIYAVAKELGITGTELCIFVKDQTNYFPPFLDGEDRPGEHVYFDGQNITDQYNAEDES